MTLQDLSYPAHDIDAPAQWKQILAEGFEWLRQEVVRRTFDYGQARAHVEGLWKDYVARHHPQKTDLEQQWQTLRRWAWCAGQALDPPRIESEADYTDWVALKPGRPDFIRGHEAWALDCIRLLSAESPSAPTRRVRVPTAVVRVHDKKQPAELVYLDLEILRPGAGQAIHDPRDAIRSVPKPDFAQSIQIALKAARLPSLHAGAEPLVYGRWRVVGEDGEPVAHIEDESAGGAAVLGWYCALTNKVPDGGVIVLAKAEASGRLDEVEGVAAKVEAIVRANRFDTIVIASEKNRVEAERALPRPAQGDRIAVVLLNPAGVNQLVHLRSQLADDLIKYLDERANWAAE